MVSFHPKKKNQFNPPVNLYQNLVIKNPPTPQNNIILHWTKFKINGTILTETKKRAELNKIKSNKTKFNESGVRRLNWISSKLKKCNL